MTTINTSRSDNRFLLGPSSDSLFELDQGRLGTCQSIEENFDDLKKFDVPRDLDLLFLQELVDKCRKTNQIFLEDLEPMRFDSLELLDSILHDLYIRARSSPKALQLLDILSDINFRSLLESHDKIAAIHLARREEKDNNETKIYPDTMSEQYINIKKPIDEPLGITVCVENSQLMIARVIEGGLVDCQGVLRTGDVIKEANSRPVNSAIELQNEINKSQGDIVLKIIPCTSESLPRFRTFVKTHYNYDPYTDGIIPCKEVGLSFQRGDILEIVNMDDDDWWQARHVTHSGRAGLIPSQQLEEKRKAFVRPEHTQIFYSKFCGTMTMKRKKKINYESKRNAEFDRCELLLYEEVTRMPPFQRKTLVLIGAQGVGRRSLKFKLINSDPSRFATTIPYTTRTPNPWEFSGKNYHFVNREIMEAEIANGLYLEHGEYAGNLYGTKLDSIKEVINSDHMCILDCGPQSLKLLNTAEFMPFVVFIAAPSLKDLRQMYKTGILDRTKSEHSIDKKSQNSCDTIKTDNDLQRTVEESGRLQSVYGSLFDLTIVNSNFDMTFQTLKESLNFLSIESQWIPVSWVY